MSKKYELVIGQTYATLKKVFKAGETFTEEELGDDLNAQNDDGENYFAEAEAAPKKTIAVGGKKQKAAEGGEGDGGKSGDGSTVTV